MFLFHDCVVFIEASFLRLNVYSESVTSDILIDGFSEEFSREKDKLFLSCSRRTFLDAFLIFSLYIHRSTENNKVHR